MCIGLKTGQSQLARVYQHVFIISRESVLQRGQLALGPLTSRRSLVVPRSLLVLQGYKSFVSHKSCVRGYRFFLSVMSPLCYRSYLVFHCNRMCLRPIDTGKPTYLPTYLPNWALVGPAKTRKRCDRVGGVYHWLLT